MVLKTRETVFVAYVTLYGENMLISGVTIFGDGGMVSVCVSLQTVSPSKPQPGIE